MPPAPASQHAIATNGHHRGTPRGPNKATQASARPIANDNTACVKKKPGPTSTRVPRTPNATTNKISTTNSTTSGAAIQNAKEAKTGNGRMNFAKTKQDTGAPTSPISNASAIPNASMGAMRAVVQQSENSSRALPRHP